MNRQTFRARATIAATALVVSSCASVSPNVPLRGDCETIVQLVGKWEGVYSAEASGRSGVISFSLRAGSDTAQGDVLMVPRNDQNTGNTAADDPIRKPPPSVALLTIRFVAAARNEIRGVLDPYTDPVCGCLLTTRFQGRLNGDEITGTFESTGTEIFHGTTQGKWSVRRSPLTGRSEKRF